MDNCIFCKIVKGELPAYKVLETDKVLAFLDIGPVNQGHTLVIPKEHFKTVFDIPEELLKEVIAVVKKVILAVKAGISADGVSLNQSNLKAAGQAVPHLHFHIIPRFADDGLKLWPQGKYGEGEAEGTLNKIKVNL